MLEPEAGNIASTIAREVGGDAVDGIALMSIAVSLKRIADAIEGTPSKMGLADTIGQAIGDGIFGASQR